MAKQQASAIEADLEDNTEAYARIEGNENFSTSKKKFNCSGTQRLPENLFQKPNDFDFPTIDEARDALRLMIEYLEQEPCRATTKEKDILDGILKRLN